MCAGVPPDGHNVGEEQQEAEDLQVPATSKVLQSHHDQRHHHQRPKQDLRQTVHLQVKEANLGHEHRDSQTAVGIFTCFSTEITYSRVPKGATSETPLFPKGQYIFFINTNKLIIKTCPYG